MAKKKTPNRNRNKSSKAARGNGKLPQHVANQSNLPTIVFAVLGCAAAFFYAYQTRPIHDGADTDHNSLVTNDAVAIPDSDGTTELSVVSECAVNISHQVVFEQLAHIKVWTIQSFLPSDQAEALHARLKAHPVPAEGSDGDAWVYTSNKITDRGRGTNHKMRGNTDIADRRGRAQYARSIGSFAYSKNELNATNPTYQQIQRFFESSNTLKCMSELTGIDLVEITDMFVSMYIKGDFLTTHQDFNLGTYAFVLQLSKDWKEGDGGELVFSCNHDRFRPDLCKVALPSFNTLTLFSTRPQLVDHFVEEVVVPPHKNRRLAVTGWIASADDKGFDKNTIDLKVQKGTY